MKPMRAWPKSSRCSVRARLPPKSSGPTEVQRVSVMPGEICTNGTSRSVSASVMSGRSPMGAVRTIPSTRVWVRNRTMSPVAGFCARRPQQERIAVRLADPEDAIENLLDVAEFVRVFIEQANGEGAPAGEPPGGGIGLVLQLANRLHHPFPGLGAHVGFAVDDPRDGLDGNPRATGNVTDCGAGGRLPARGVFLHRVEAR